MQNRDPGFQLALTLAVLALILIAGLQVILWIAGQQISQGTDGQSLTLLNLIGSVGLLLLCLAVWVVLNERLLKPLKQPQNAQARSARIAQTSDFSEQDSAKRDGDLFAQILRDLPSAVILLNAKDRIVLYNGAANDLIGGDAPLRLDAPITHHRAVPSLNAARQMVRRTGLGTQFQLALDPDAPPLTARMEPLEDHGALLVLESSGTSAPPARASLTYDFSLLSPESACERDQIPLTSQPFVVLSTQTTGLLPHRDEVLRISAVRMLGGRILAQETLDLRVTPGPREGGGDTAETHPTRLDILTASVRLHDFAKGAAIVAHNTPLVMAFLRRHQRAAGLTWQQPEIDLVLLSALIFGARSDHGLATLAARSGLDWPSGGNRGGLRQALAMAGILQRLLPQLADRNINSLSAVIEAQERQAARIERRL